LSNRFFWSSFIIRITRDITRKQPWRIKPIFSIELHIRDKYLLEKIKNFFGVGQVTTRERKGKFSTIYSVQSIKDINNVIIPHFLNYPLLTEKRKDFKLFCLAMDLINKQEHLNIEGIKKIISIRASMNRKYVSRFNIYFPNIIPYYFEDIIDTIVIPDIYWIIGFIDAEGCFYIKPVINKFRVVNFLPVFSISQHSRDSLLIEKIKKFLDCGLLESPSSRKEVRFVVYKISDHLEKIIPLFSEYKLQSTKCLDFYDYTNIINIKKDKKGKILSEEDILKIQSIKLNMNKNRII
jgi:LAGLIDADG endonuclease